MSDDADSHAVDLDAARAFTTYRHYLSALSTFTRTTYGGSGGYLRSLGLAQRSLNGFGRLRQRAPEPPGVRELLFNAWHTEVALGLPEISEDPGLIRFTNQWAPVQAYYAVYCLWRAWFVVERTQANTHIDVLRSASSVVQQRFLLPPPWSYACSGGFLIGECQHIGFQAGQMVDVNPLSTPGALSASEDWVSKTLRTTRRFFLDQREARWKRENRTKNRQPYRRIPSAERKRIRGQFHSTTLFDFLYRLRIRSNYRDVDDFVSGQLDDADALVYFESLLSFTQSTMLLLESIIRATMPPGAYDGHAHQFLESTHGSKYRALADRLVALRATDSP